MEKDNKGLENLRIYSEYINLIYYTNMILKKYPKCEIFSLAKEIEVSTYDILKFIIEAQKNKKLRLSLLNKIDTNIKYLLVLVRVSYKSKYISYQNYKAWCGKLNFVNKLNIG